MQCEAVNYRRLKRKKKKSVKHRFKVLLFIIFLLIAAFVCYYFCVVTPVVCTLSEEKIRSLSTIAISQAVEEVLIEQDVSYDELISVQYNGQNEIVAVQSDSVKINMLVRSVTELVQEKIDNLNGEGISIALGTFTGIPFLFELGPNINLKLIPVGTVSTSFDSQFISAGVNQTKHSLYFNISANVGLILPARTKNFVTSLQIMICECIIPGKVPQVYLDGSFFCLAMY